MHNFSPAATSYLERHAVDLDLAWDRVGVRSDRDDITYPYMTPKGETFRRRRGPGGVVKQPKDQPLVVWFPDGRPQPGADILLTEGEGDALAALSATNRLGVIVASLPGTSTPVERITAELGSAGTVYLALDGDKPGRDATEKIARALQQFVALKLIRIADGEDLASSLFAESDRPAWLRAAIENAEDVPKLRPLKEESGGYHTKAADRKRELLTKGFDPDRINVGELLDDVVNFLCRYVFMSKSQATVLALWVAHCHTLESSRVTPYISVTSAEPGSGKTLLLEVLAMIVPRPWLTGRTSAAVLPRKIEDVTPILLLDESDAAFKGDKDYANALRGVLNSGYKRSGVSTICVGQGAAIDYKDFHTFCPKVIAGLGQLPDTVRTRSFPIRLLKIANETVEEFEEEAAEAPAAELRDRLEAFALNATAKLKGAKPERPAGLDPRTKEIGRPLLAVADLADGEWPERARFSLLELVDAKADEDESIPVQLLADIRTVLDEKGDDRIATKDLAASLHALEDRPWGDWYGKPISSRKLVGLLKPFGLKARSVWEGSGRTRKGFLRDQFTDAWQRHLSQNPLGNRAGGQDSSTEPETPDSYRAGDEPPVRYKTPQTALQSHPVRLPDTEVGQPLAKAEAAGLAYAEELVSAEDATRVEPTLMSTLTQIPTPAICRYGVPSYAERNPEIAERHRESDWLSQDGKRLICGTCHPGYA